MDAMCENESARDLDPRPHGARFPLNSRRLTAAHLRSIAHALDLPARGSSDQLRQCVEGHLQTEGREASNTLVTVRDSPKGGTILKLADSEGTFLEVNPSSTETTAATEANSVSRNEMEEGRQALQDARQELEEAQGTIREQEQQIAQLQADLEVSSAAGPSSNVATLRASLATEKERVRQMWRLNYEYAAEQDALLATKDEEIAALKVQLVGLREDRTSPGEGSPPHALAVTRPLLHASRVPTNPLLTGTGATPTPQRRDLRRGKAPPVDPFTGENPEVHLDDWLPMLERAAEWNGWSGDDRLLQLAGHLRGRAFQEWNLLEAGDKASYTTAVECLRVRLDPGSRAVAAQEFQHSLQAHGEGVADFVLRLECTFRIAYGREKLSPETRDALLYGQLQEGLCYSLAQAPAVSGAQSFKELCTAAKSEEKRLAALKQRRQRDQPSRHPEPQHQPRDQPSRYAEPPSHLTRTTSLSTVEPRRCFKCG